MKKILRLLLTCILMLTLTLAFTACIPTEEGEKTITIIIVNPDGTGTSYTEITDSLHLGEALDEMLAEEDITLVTESSLYGRFIKSIGSLNPESNQWINIHSDETDPTLVSEDGEWSPIIVYNDVTYKMTLLGLDDMPIYDGRTYVFSISE